MSSDNESILSLLHNSGENSQEFAQKTLEYLRDLNGGSHTSQVNFETESMTSKYVVYKDGYLQLPVTISGTFAGVIAGTATVAPYIGWKGSVLSLIKGIQITTSSGQMILNEQDSHFINNLRLLIQESEDWEKTNGALLGFAKDGTLPNVQSTLTSGANLINPRQATWIASPSGSSNSYNSNYNVGFARRNIYMLESATTYSSSAITTIVCIPLKYIHPIFEQLDFPITNTRLNFNFLLNTTNHSTYHPLCSGTLLGGATEGTATVAITPSSQCRLYYHSVLFEPQMAQQVAQKLISGFSKSISFPVTEVYRVNNVASTASFSHEVGRNIVAPIRVFGICSPYAADLDSVNYPSPIVSGSFSLTNTNILINNTRYFNNDLTNVYEQWSQLKEQFPPSMAGSDNSCLLSFSDFLSSYRINVWDVSRKDSRMRDINQSCNLTIIGNCASATAQNIVYLIEREVKLRIDFSSSELKVTVGPNASN